MFRGREQAHPERGRALLQKLYEDLGGLATIESDPLQEGRNMSMLLAPSKEALAAEKPAESEGAAPAPEAESAPAADAAPEVEAETEAAPEADAAPESDAPAADSSDDA
jgi:translation initiation factor IF-3